MRKKDVIIVEPSGVEANVFSKYIKLPLMGTVYLGTILKKHGFNVRILNENILGRKLMVDELQGDFLLLSLLTSTAPRGYEIARQFKQMNRNSKVIIGGIHPTFMPDEAARFADHVVLGEGENIIIDLLKYGSDETIIQGEFLTDLDQLPLPDFSLIAKGLRSSTLPVMTSRGCPFDCNFCLVTQMFGKHYRFNSVDHVMEDLRQVDKPLVFFYDDNFTANRKRSYQLLERMAKARKQLRFRWWTAQVRADVAKDEQMVKLMARTGCYRVYIGFESINPQALKEMNKKQSPEEIEACIRTLHKHRIRVHGMFIFGSDADTPATVKQTVQFARRMRIDTVQFMVLTPMPGTETYRRIESSGKLLHNNWQYFDGMHVVFEPSNMEPDTLQSITIDAYEQFYSYFSVMREAVYELVQAGREIGASYFTRVKIPDFSNLAHKLFAKHIVKRWQKLNLDYMRYLSKVKELRQSLRNTTSAIIKENL